MSKLFFLALLSLLTCSLAAVTVAAPKSPPTKPATTTAPTPQRIKLSANGKSFVRTISNEKFTPWGFNYDRDHRLRLLEDYWDAEWERVEQDFREMRDLGANVVRVHLQLGSFMNSPTEPNEGNLQRLRRLALFAESQNLYLDITGLGAYRKRDTPAWYDKLDEPTRWEAQANFWSAVAAALADRPGVFCYDLVNEPVIPADAQDGWVHPLALAGFHYVQFIARDPAGRDANDIAREWTRKMTAAIRAHDRNRLITVGMLPIAPADATKARGFVPAALKDDLDFIAVHVYPESRKLDAALATLKLFDVGKPLVIEETFPLVATAKEFGEFLSRSRDVADGWIGFYWGKTPAEMKDDPGVTDKAMLAWLDLFKKLNPTTTPATAPR
jgi:hypothetical protein